MSESEKNIIKIIAAALPNMTEFDKGYFLGVAESRAGDSCSQKKKFEEEKDSQIVEHEPVA